MSSPSSPNVLDLLDEALDLAEYLLWQNHFQSVVAEIGSADWLAPNERAMLGETQILVLLRDQLKQVVNLSEN